MKSVMMVTSSGTCSTLPMRCDSDGSASVTTGAPVAPGIVDQQIHFIAMEGNIALRSSPLSPWAAA